MNSGRTKSSIELIYKYFYDTQFKMAILTQTQLDYWQNELGCKIELEKLDRYALCSRCSDRLIFIKELSDENTGLSSL